MNFLNPVDSSMDAPIVVAQLTDTHLFADATQQMLGCATERSLQTVVDAIHALTPQPDVLLLTGDLSQDETVESYERLRQMISPLAIPTYRIPGNHDILPRLQATLRGIPFVPDWQFEWGGWGFLLLDSTVPGSTAGALTAESLMELDEQLTQRPQLPTVVALHHPPVPIGSGWMDALGLQNADALYQVLDRHPQVKLVLFGHIHQAFDGMRQGVRYLGSPSTCIQFTPHSPTFAIDSSSPGFRLLKLYRDGHYDTTIHRVAQSKPNRAIVV